MLMGIGCFTKWIEDIPLVNVDQEAVFTGQMMQEFAKEIGIKLLTSTPYYAQANGQVEAANKVVIGLIKKHVG